jgi:tetratricopeptide (TPR) repeat protein
LGKLIQFSSDKSRRRALKKAGTGLQTDPAQSGQLDLFKPASDSAKGSVQHILTFANPFARALYLDQQNHQEAENAYVEAIEQNVHAADAWCNLAIIYADRHDDLQAIDALSKAITQQPRHALSHYNIANLYLDHGDLNLARLHYEIAKQIDPDFAEVYFNLGLVYLIKGSRKAAIEMLRKYEELMPGGLDELEAVLKDLGG